MGRVAGIDKLRDLAAIEMLDETDLIPLRGKSPLYRDTGLAVMSAGYSSRPPVGWPNVRVGVVTKVALLPWLDNLFIFETDATFDPGDSGGPLFDRKGNVIGSASLRLATPERNQEVEHKGARWG